MKSLACANVRGRAPGRGRDENAAEIYLRAGRLGVGFARGAAWRP